MCIYYIVPFNKPGICLVVVVSNKSVFTIALYYMGNLYMITTKCRPGSNY